MIERAAGAAVSLILAAGTAQAAQPMVRHFFGMPFEVPAMIAALFGCIVTRVIVGQSDTVSRWFVRVPVDVLTGGITFFLVVSARPGLLSALLLGITIASLGATIIKIAEARGRKLLDALLPGAADPPPPPPPPNPDQMAGIGAAMRDLNAIDEEPPSRPR